MAAVQASQHSPAVCQTCGKPFENDYLARQICRSCGAPQSVTPGETFFTVLGAPEKFSQNLSELQKRFYEISRSLHPDRFTTADPGIKQRSLERMSFVNEAYRTLRDPEALRAYVLELHGFKLQTESRGQIPMELAESWFELQDVLAENPGGASAKTEVFNEEIKKYREAAVANLRAIETNLDSLDPASPQFRAGLDKLSRAIHELSYLKSLARDVERLSSRNVAHG